MKIKVKINNKHLLDVFKIFIFTSCNFMNFKIHNNEDIVYDYHYSKFKGTNLYYFNIINIYLIIQNDLQIFEFKYH